MNMDFHPFVGEWFRRSFRAPTPPQEMAWRHLASGEDVLISAPTGSGKTLAAFLSCLDLLVRRALDGTLEDATEAVYVSPLKALSNDIRKNLERPLAEIRALAEGAGLAMQPIRVALRTGDTPARERLAMVKKHPHILVTTPESLFILLTAESGRKMLARARTLVVDEVHAVIDDKRGAHLALSMARLDALVADAGGPVPRRVGLSATVKPIDEVARFLRPEGGVRIVDHGHRRRLDLAVEVPRDELGPVATNPMWEEIYDRIARLILEHRTTLVFVNTRRLSERVAHHLAGRLGEAAVLAHHGSLSREIRLDAEHRLKNGDLRAVVATASLELGIDVGSVDLVVQIGSPRSIGAALQRVGRSGHQALEESVPKGRLFATTRDELVECAALVRAISSGRLDAFHIPPWPRDILAQQIVAIAAASGEEGWSEDRLYALATRAWPYRDLPRGEFDAVIGILSEGIATDRGRSGAFLHRDRVNLVVRARRGARLAAITSGGAIPDNANYYVVAEPEQTVVGTVDEDFAVESLAGDVFLLGTSSWRIRRVEAGRVRVENAHGAAPTIPFWRGEAPGRTFELSEEVAKLRKDALEAASPSEWLVETAGLDPRGAEQAAEYLQAGRAALGALPTLDTVVAERFFDEGGGMQLVIHAPLGARINRAWGLALRKRFCRTFNFELQAAATDNGIVISLGEQHSFPLAAVFEFLDPATVEDLLTQALLPAPMFTSRWRWNASRALAVLRFAGGRKVPPPLQRMRSDDLLAAVFPDQAACGENLTGDIRIPDHPLVNETIRDCLHEAMDLEGLRVLLGAIRSGALRTVAIDTAEPSPFSHEILNANPYAFLDDAPLEERRTRAVQMRRTLHGADEVGALDPRAILEVRSESWPVVRNPDELHDALLTLVALRESADWQDYFPALEAAKRATTIELDGARIWVAAERLATARLLYPAGRVSPAIPSFESDPPADADAAATELLRGWLESTGPATSRGLATDLGLPEDRVERSLARLESRGEILRGQFTPGEKQLEWSNRRLLARIHRLTLGRLRREIEPVSSADFVRFLFAWQHVAPGTRLHGVDGTLSVIRQLQGYEVSAAAWESGVLAERIARYAPEWLDQLCLSGEIMWARLSLHPSFATVEDGGQRRRVRPTRVAPVALFLREDAAWLVEARAGGDLSALSYPARDLVDALRSRGASFLPELVQATGRLRTEVEDGLWELASSGLVTADGFDNLRALVDPKRRRGEGRARKHRPRHAAGRWALLEPARPDLSASVRTERTARQLLDRWGVVFRDLIARETLAPPWRDLLVVLRRLEARGEIRGGRFVAGFPGEQFARPDAIDLVRALRRSPSQSPLRISAADPLNLAGIITPGGRTHPLASEVVDLLAG
jgi:ATP-dependent Lhr-like helicase